MTITPLCNLISPKKRFPWITHASLSCEVDPVAHIRLDTAFNTGYAQTAPPSVFTDSVPDDYATEVLLAHTKRVDAPSCLNKALIRSAAPSPLMPPVHYIPVTCPRNLRDISVQLLRPTGYGIVAIIYSVRMYIIPIEIIQCDVLSCLAETDECIFNHSSQLAPGNLDRLAGSPALTGLDMVETIPAYDGLNPSSCFVFSG